MDGDLHGDRLRQCTRRLGRGQLHLDHRPGGLLAGRVIADDLGHHLGGRLQEGLVAVGHDIQIALVLFGGLLLDAVDDAPRVGGQRRCGGRHPLIGLRRCRCRRDCGRQVCDV